MYSGPWSFMKNDNSLMPINSFSFPSCSFRINNPPEAPLYQELLKMHGGVSGGLRLLAIRICLFLLPANKLVAFLQEPNDFPR